MGHDEGAHNESISSKNEIKTISTQEINDMMCGQMIRIKFSIVKTLGKMFTSHHF